MIGDPYAKVGLVGVLMIGVFGLGVAIDRVGGGRLVRASAQEGALTPEVPYELPPPRPERPERHTALVALSVPQLASVDPGSVQIATPGYSLDGAQIRPVYEYRRDSDPKPRSILLLMDNSRSMVDSSSSQGPASDPGYQRLDAGRSLINSLSPKDRVSLACFPCRLRVLNQVGEAHPIRPFELLARAQPPDLTKSSIDLLRNEENGSTPLYRAVREAAETLGQEPKENKRILVVLTDGVDTEKFDTDLQAALDAIQAANIEVYGVGLGNGSDMSVLKTMAPAPGHTLRADDAGALDRAFQKIVLQMSRAVAKVDLEVTVARNGRRIPPGQKLEITFRSGGKLYRTEGKTR